MIYYDYNGIAELAHLLDLLSVDVTISLLLLCLLSVTIFAIASCAITRDGCPSGHSDGESMSIDAI